MIVQVARMVHDFAEDRTRTGTGFLPRDFKSLASANSATPANRLLPADSLGQVLRRRQMILPPIRHRCLAALFGPAALGFDAAFYVEIVLV